MKALLLFLFAFGFQITTGNVTVVQTCPETKATWDHRSSIFACEDGNTKYHCVMTSIWNLVEVCITPMNITGNEKGCPLVYVLNSAAIWVSSFTPCPVQNKECPQDGHGGYSTEQLYKYPPCFRNISDRTSGESDLTKTTLGTRASTGNFLHKEACKSDTEYLPYTTVAMFLLLASIHVFIILLYWKIRKVEVMVQEGNRLTSYISGSSSNTSSLFKGSDDIPLTRRINSYVSVPSKKVVKGKDYPSPSVSDSSKGTSSTVNYESPVEKESKGNDVTTLSDSDTTNYENCSLEKESKGNKVTTLSDSDTTSYENCTLKKDLEGSDYAPPSVPDTRTEERHIMKIA